MKSQVVAAVAALGIVLSGCATVIKGSHQSIGIVTPPTEGATCTLTNGAKSWEVVSPGAVTVDRSKHDMQIRCVKQGWRDANATIPSNFEGWTLGNLIIGGVIGLGIDAATGSINQYPHAFQVPMVEGVGSPAPPPRPLPPGQVPAAEPNAPWPATPVRPATDPGSGAGSYASGPTQV